MALRGQYRHAEERKTDPFHSTFPAWSMCNGIWRFRARARSLEACGLGLVMETGKTCTQTPLCVRAPGSPLEQRFTSTLGRRLLLLHLCLVCCNKPRFQSTTAQAKNNDESLFAQPRTRQKQKKKTDTRNRRHRHSETETETETDTDADTSRDFESGCQQEWEHSPPTTDQTNPGPVADGEPELVLFSCFGTVEWPKTGKTYFRNGLVC